MRFLCSLGREEDKPIYSPSKPEQLLFLWPFPTWPSSPAACRPLTLWAPRCSELCPPLVLWADLPSLSPSCLLTLLDPDLPKCLRAPCQVLGKISFAQRQGLPLGFPPIFAVNWGLLHLTWRRVAWAETWLLWPTLPSPGSSGNFQCSLLGHWVSEVWLRGLSMPQPQGRVFL